MVLILPAERQDVWNYLQVQYRGFQRHPWVLMGDFNATLRASDSEGGGQILNGHKLSFGECLQQTELIPVPYRGLKYSWHNGQGEDRMIMKKLDWVIGNTTLLKIWPDAITHFLTRSASDHSSMVLQLSRDHCKPQPRFLFLNFWTEREDFVPHIAQIWQKHAHGSPIFKLSTKLQWVKSSLMNWHSTIEATYPPELTKRDSTGEKLRKDWTPTLALRWPEPMKGTQQKLIRSFAKMKNPSIDKSPESNG
ncbi:hypothetical protein OIU84_027830 [Salix udensis]|uniref:Endonuclease/exonuclease/phosphatase domain-containing protein n=1 Tax=Salix udensis TaxID=889485 RepID=A0AAD6NMV5_9ROSI|nr:hypothetical protein OIU84_027830 [Salix udensis]